ncbi:MAG: hypothetical protein AAF601_05575 [Pseudomonadota bacterium]
MRAKQVLVVSALAGLLSGSAFAQSFSAEPIAFDLSDELADGSPVLIAAYEPTPDARPSFAGAGSDRSAAVTNAGLPAPSIILGRVEPGREADFGIETLLPDTVAQLGFAFDDLETRVAMRDSDPDLFRQLLEQGHIDPPADQLNVALQTELKRMNCYRSTIDGLWGRGSARSVGEYFGERADGASWPDQQPSMQLFRAIIAVPDVACEAPVAAAPARTTTTRSTQQRTTTTRPTPAPAPAPAPKPANKPRISGGGGIGVFR